MKRPTALRKFADALYHKLLELMPEGSTDPIRVTQIISPVKDGDVSIILTHPSWDRLKTVIMFSDGTWSQLADYHKPQYMFDPPILEKPYSDHPDDAFLSVVLHRNFKGEWVTHVRNNQDGGFSHGHYFTDLADAAKDYNERGVKPEPSTI